MLYYIFFDELGPVAQISVPKGWTNKTSFDVVLSEVEKSYIKRRPATGTRGFKILHDKCQTA